MTTPFVCGSRSYTFALDTEVIVTHRDDGFWPWFNHPRYGMTLFTTRTIGEMKSLIAANGQDLFDTRIVWANNEADALDLWEADNAQAL